LLKKLYFITRGHFMFTTSTGLTRLVGKKGAIEI